MVDGGKQTSSIPDPGLAALVMLLRLQGIGVDPEQIRHQFGTTPIGVPEMLRYAKGFGFKARRQPWGKRHRRARRFDNDLVLARFADQQKAPVAQGGLFWTKACWQAAPTWSLRKLPACNPR
jgi:hypothetical protein